MMASLASIIFDTEEMLYGMARVERPDEDTVGSGGIDGSATTLPVSTVAMWKRGDFVEVAAAAGAVGEIMVAAADGAAGNVTVRRAQRGSTAAVAAAGDVLRRNPLFPRTVLARFVEEVVAGELWPHVWYRSNRTLTYTANDRTYPLDAADVDVISVYQYDVDGNQEFIPLHRGAWDVREVDTTVAASGRLLLLSTPPSVSDTVYYTARTRPTFAGISSIPEQVAAMIPWAVCGKVLGGTRSSAWRFDPNRQGLPEVQDGGPSRDWRFFTTEFLRMRAEETRRLRVEERAVAQRVYRPSRPRRWG